MTPEEAGAKAAVGQESLLDLPAFLRRQPIPVFRDIDAPWCPELVELPPGQFMMGSPDSDEDASDEERPQHQVRIAYRLAIGRYPVTFKEYDHFCLEKNKQKVNDVGWGRGRRPVFFVTRQDADEYLAWLSEKIGKEYRLLSEADWEYACRAGTTTRYSFGDYGDTTKANFGGNVCMTTEVGDYPPNPWGLYDMHGNVCEFVADDWHDSYEGAPDDGSSWGPNARSGHVVCRGGSYSGNSRNCRSAARIKVEPHARGQGLGFRIARMLT